MLLVTLSLVRLGIDTQMLAHVDSLRGRGALTDNEVPVIDNLRVGTTWAVWVARLLLGAAIVAWMAVARRIVQGYDCDLYRSDPGFAVAGWFIPGMNIAAPYVLMADVWTASHPSRRPEAIVDQLRVPLRIGLWWGLFMFSLVVSCMGLLDGVHGGDPWAPFDVGLDVMTRSAQILSALLLAWIVVRATGFIEQRSATSTP